jgi:hypothetical protein
MVDPDLGELLAERQIRGVLSRYAHGIDSRDWDLVRSCYHPDATDHRSRFQGGVEEFIAWVSGVVAAYEVTQHHLTTCVIEIDGDAATAETYLWVLHFERSQGEGGVLFVGARYQDRFECRDGRWRIARRVVAYDYGEQRRVDGSPPFDFGDRAAVPRPAFSPLAAA